MKQHCYDCRALGGFVNDLSCKLGYKIDQVKKRVAGLKGTFTYVPVPKELCPKPRTWTEYLDTPMRQEATND